MNRVRRRDYNKYCDNGMNGGMRPFIFKFANIFLLFYTYFPIAFGHTIAVSHTVFLGASRTMDFRLRHWRRPRIPATTSVHESRTFSDTSVVFTVDAIIDTTV